MNDLFARSVFFVKEAERSLKFYTETLGFSVEWNHQEQGRTFVFEVSLLGFQLILNQTEPGTEDRAGHGRVFMVSRTIKSMHFANTSRKRALRRLSSSGAPQHS